MVKLKRAEEHLLAVQKCDSRSRKQVEENLAMNSGIWTVAKQYRVSIKSQKMSSERPTTVARQKYITNQALDKHRSTLPRTRRILVTEARVLEHQSRFECVWIKELAEAENCKSCW